MSGRGLDTIHPAMSQSHPGLPRAIAGFVRRIAFDSLSRAFLGVLFGLPVLVVAVGASVHVPWIPSYFAGFAVVALLGIVVRKIGDSVAHPHEFVDLDETELDQSQLRVFVVTSVVMTFSWVSALVLVGASVGAVIQYTSGVGYLAALLAAAYPLVDSWIARRHPRLSVGTWAVEGSFELCHAFLTLRYGSGEAVDQEVEQSARRSGPII